MTAQGGTYSCFIDYVCHACLSLQTFAINFDNLMTFLPTNQEFLYTNNIVWLIISTKNMHYSYHIGSCYYVSWQYWLVCILQLVIISIDKHSYFFLHCGITFWYVILFYFEFDSHIYIYIYIYTHMLGTTFYDVFHFAKQKTIYLKRPTVFHVHSSNYGSNNKGPDISLMLAVVTRESGHRDICQQNNNQQLWSLEFSWNFAL